MMITPRSSHVAKPGRDPFIGVSSHSSDSIVFEDSQSCESLSGSFAINPKFSENRIGTEAMKVSLKNDSAWFTLSTCSSSESSSLESQEKMTEKEREARARAKALIRKIQNANDNGAENSMVDAPSTKTPLHKQNTDYGIGWQPRKPVFAPPVQNDAKIADNRVSKIAPMTNTEIRKPVFVPYIRNDAKMDGSRVSKIPRLTSSEVTVRKMAEKWEQKIQDLTSSRHTRSYHSPQLIARKDAVPRSPQIQKSLERPVPPTVEITDHAASPGISSPSDSNENYSEFEDVTEETNERDTSRPLEGFIQALSTNSETIDSSYTDYESETGVQFESDIEETEFSEDETEYEDVTETNEEEEQQILKVQEKNPRRIPIEILIQMQDESIANDSLYTETKSFAEEESSQSALYIVIPQGFPGAKEPERVNRSGRRKIRNGKSQELKKSDALPPMKREKHKRGLKIRDDRNRKLNKTKNKGKHKRENRIRDDKSQKPTKKKKKVKHKRENRIRDSTSQKLKKNKRKKHKRENRIQDGTQRKLRKSDVLPPKKREHHMRENRIRDGRQHEKKTIKKKDKRENQKRENRIQDDKQQKLKKSDDLPPKKREHHTRENRIRDDRQHEKKTIKKKDKRENQKRENRIRDDKQQKLKKSDDLSPRPKFLPARPPSQTLKKSDYLSKKPTMKQMVSPQWAMAPDLETGIQGDDGDEESIRTSDIQAVAIWRSEQLAEDARREAKIIKQRMIVVSIILVVAFGLIIFVFVDPLRQWL